MHREEEIITHRDIPYPYSIDPDEMVARFRNATARRSPTFSSAWAARTSGSAPTSPAGPRR